jgi:hypothetical protein
MNCISVSVFVYTTLVEIVLINFILIIIINYNESIITNKANKVNKINKINKVKGK